MALERYNAKRDFTRTAEPEGKAAQKAGNSFVIQKHAARRLHYDFRLEMDGVLKSWAVTRGPSLVAGEKRLAVHVEDHPLDYGGFEGTIPKGEYGGGSVIVWDRGHWTPVYDTAKMYAKGHMEFELDGEKLQGRWHLVRMAPRKGEKNDNWLLIKAEDETARPPDAADILEELPNSVLTGRPVEALEGEEPGWSSKTGRIAKEGTDGETKKSPRKTSAVKAPAKKPAARKPAAKKAAEPEKDAPHEAAETIDPFKLKKAKPSGLPDFLEPQLATLTAKPPVGKRWLHEVKFDGYRLQVRIEAGRVKLLTRSGLDWTKKFGKGVVEAFQALRVGKALIDGEIVVENDAGGSDFSALQADLSEGKNDRFLFYAFDLLHLDGADLTEAPLFQRKDLLRTLIEGEAGLIRFSADFPEEGELVLKHACRLSLEGIVSKVREAPFRPGRGKDWLKSKCSSRQEFAVAGYVPSTASRRAIGSLVMGVYENGRLLHVGRVGTGYTVAVAEDLMTRLEKIRIDKSPFAEKLPTEAARGVKYCRPELVAEVEFRAWTADGNLRHAAFRGLREDKPAVDIIRESGPGAAEVEKPQERTVKLTHPDRVYWPDTGVTKEGLADYYAEVWRFIAPFVVNRPLSLLRCPEGVGGGQSFFQKHAWKGMNAKIGLFQDPQDDPDEKLLVINDFDGLIGLVQGATLEIHPWGSTLVDLERPDMIIMDLDPAEGVAWADVISAAYAVKGRLEAEGLAAFVKTSGGKGLHVVSPIRPSADWGEAKAFTKRIADQMTKDEPDRYVATVTKAKRQGKILIDYLRNGRGATAVAPYSSRARPGAAVSMPLAWDELTEGLGPSYFTILNATSRLSTLSKNPWEGFRAAAAPIET